MKRKSIFKTIIATLVLFAIMPMTVLPSSATAPSPPTNISGSIACGAEFPKESSVVIENQTITFDISKFPTFDDEEKIKNYNASVKTEYTLFNPNENEITLTVKLPVEKGPYYTGVLEDPNLSKYSITINGKTIEPAYENAFFYDITIQPGERVINTIIAPIYPNIETKYEPPTFNYNYEICTDNAYLFNGKIHVNIYTPYYMLDNTNEIFEKTENGYSTSFYAMEELSNNSKAFRGGVYFTLCSVESPEETMSETSIILAILLIIIIPITIGISVVRQFIHSIFHPSL